MPNWCENEVVITGLPTVISEIKAIIDKNPEGFQMNDFVPIPEETLNAVKDYSKQNLFISALKGDKSVEYDNWYDWSIAWWGTKWDVSEPYLSVVDNSIFMGFTTAWSPNVNFWAEFTKLYPVKISHRYFEEGVSFIGEATIEAGNIDDYCVDISDEIYKKAGAVLDKDGCVEDDSSYNLYEVFPLRSH
jgi:hypothetical protein